MYTDQQIKDFIGQQGIADNPHAIYNFAKQYGVAPGRLDSVMGWSSGTADRWIQEQGLQGLAGSAYGGSAPTTGTYTDQQVRDFAQSRGVADNPHALRAFAQQYGVGAGQIDSAMGYAPGTAANWVQQRGLAALPGGSAGGGGLTLAPNPPGGYHSSQGAQQQASTQQASTQQQGTPSMGAYQPNPNANPYTPMAGGWDSFNGQTMQGQPPPGPLSWGGGGAQSTTPGANPYTSWMADSIGQRLGQNLQRNILPGIRSAASAAGGLGGSRQGIAEGIAIGDTMTGYGNTLANLYSGQFNADRNYGLANDALDLNVYNTNQNWMRQGQQDQLGLADRLLGWNQNYGVGNATQVQNTPLNYWQQFGNQASQFAGLGGSQSQNLQGNPFLGALGGAMAGSQLWKGYGG